MNIFGKILVVVVFLLSIGFAVSQMILFETREQYRAKYEDEVKIREDAERKLSETKEELSGIRSDFDRFRASKASEIDGLEQDIEDQRLRLDRLDRDNENLSDQLTKAQEIKESLIARLDDKENTIKSLETNLADRTETLQNKEVEIDELNEQIRQSRNQIAELEDNIETLTKEKETALTKLGDRERQLSQLQARGVHIDIGEPLPAIDGALSRVDNEIGVAVLNRGSEDGVEINFSFTAYRDDDFVARLYVIDVFPSHSLARVDREVTDLEERPMRIGDRITTRIE